MYDIPQIDQHDIKALLTSDYTDAVLYLQDGPDNEGGEPTLEVWTEAYVPHHQVVLRQVDVQDVVGPDVDLADGDQWMPELASIFQQDVDRVFAEVYPDQG